MILIINKKTRQIINTNDHFWANEDGIKIICENTKYIIKIDNHIYDIIHAKLISKLRKQSNKK